VEFLTFIIRTLCDSQFSEDEICNLNFEMVHAMESSRTTSHVDEELMFEISKTLDINFASRLRSRD
jgi:hypothetical protein